MQTPIVPEPDVLIRVATWLHSNGWKLEKVSTRSKDKVKTAFTGVGISINHIEFTHKGEDIRARKRDNLWRVECKGLSSGKDETVKNNFDRAVASAVSYCTQKEGLRLGLALAEGYEKFLRDKLPRDLREAINLWVFIYVKSDDLVAVFAPGEKIIE